VSLSYEYDPWTGSPKFTISVSDLLRGIFRPQELDRAEEFINVRSLMTSERGKLARLAMGYYAPRLDGVNLRHDLWDTNIIALDSWMVDDNPIDLFSPADRLKLTMRGPKKGFYAPFYAQDYFPWKGKYSVTLSEMNKRIGEKYEIPEELKPVLKNWPTYELVGFQSGERLELTCERGQYFEYVDTCELLFYEFAMAVQVNFLKKSKSPKAEKMKDSSLPVRNKVDILDFDNRSVGIGINTLLLVRSIDNIWQFYVHRRPAGAIMEAANTIHVVPAGTFQPRRNMPENPDRDFDIYRNVLREFGEEMLGKEEWQQVKTAVADIVDDPIIAPFHELFESGAARVFFLGFGLDPLTTKAEFITAMVLNEMNYYESFGRLLRFTHNWEGDFAPRLFDEDNVLEFVKYVKMLPAGAACLHLAWQCRDFLKESIL